MKQTQKGFTLVELAIVMTIIGLLIGGILKGQELMQNARVTSTVAQVRAYEAATTTFRDKYDTLPGDMVNASTRIPNCAGAGCNAQAANGGGNGIIGNPAWAGAAGGVGAAGDFTTQATGGTPLTTAVAAAAAQAFETNLFWTHLLLADLISGVTNASVSAGAMAWGETHPASKLGGGFVVGYGNGVPTPGNPAVANTGPSGMLLVILQAPNTSTRTTMTGAGTQPMTATRAAQIDRKMDDGRPGTGFVHGYGVAASCNTGGVYVESTVGNDCGVFFRIQG